MSEAAKDPAIKLFGKTIQLPEILPPPPPPLDSPAVNIHIDKNPPLSPPNSSNEEEHNSDELEEDKDTTMDPLTDSKNKSEAQPMMSEECKGPNTIAIITDKKKPLDTDAADVDDPNSEEGQSETSNSQEKILKKPDKIIPCPRCNSMETKFCYFNNYSINQPRHFCKKCQRYWTAGGTMRNVPVGAGRRKNKYLASQFRHVTVSEALQHAQVELPNGIHPTLKTNGTVLTFGSDTPLCESMASGLKISGKTILSGAQNGFNKPEEVRIPVSYGPGEIVDDHSSGSTVTGPFSKDEVCKSGLQNPVIQNCQSFPPQLPCYPGGPWPYPWNTGQWNPTVHQVPPPGFCPPGFPMPFYPAAPYWGCSVPVPPGPWNVHWLTPPNLSPSQAAACSGPNSPTLGKHSRDENIPKPAGSCDEDSVKEKKPEKCLWVPKTLRIDDPGEAAKSSIWATLGIENERADVISKGGLFKAFQSKENEKGHISDPPSVLHANPAAMSRSQSFREST